MIQQRTNEWYQARLGKATASRFHDIMSTGYNGKPLAGWKNYRAELVIERLTGTPFETFTSGPMQWGIDNEPLARLHYLLKTGNQVEECGFFEHDKLAAGASPDGLIGDDMGLEIKCPNTATHIETLRTNQVPKIYISQIQGQMWITGRKKVDFVSFDPRLPDSAKIIIIPVLRDDAYIEALEGKVRLFLREVDEEVEFINNYGKESNVQKSPVTGASNKPINQSRRLN